jgi:hypothetical protein
MIGDIRHQHRDYDVVVRKRVLARIVLKEISFDQVCIDYDLMADAKGAGANILRYMFKLAIRPRWIYVGKADLEGCRCMAQILQENGYKEIDSGKFVRIVENV